MNVWRAGSEAGEENQSSRAESDDNYLCHCEQIFTFTICVTSLIHFFFKKALLLENIFFRALTAVSKETKKKNKTREE